MTSHTTKTAGASHRTGFISWTAMYWFLAALSLAMPAQAADPLPFPLKLDASVFASQADYREFLRSYDRRADAPITTMDILLPASAALNAHPVIWVSASKGLVIGARKDDMPGAIARRFGSRGHLQLLLVDFLNGTATAVEGLGFEPTKVVYEPPMNQGYIEGFGDTKRLFHLEGETVVFDEEHPDTPCEQKRRELLAVQTNKVPKGLIVRCVTPEVFLYAEPTAEGGEVPRFLHVPGKADEAIRREFESGFKNFNNPYDDYLKGYPVTTYTPVPRGVETTYLMTDGSIKTLRIPEAVVVPFQPGKGYPVANGALVLDAANMARQTMPGKARHLALWLARGQNLYLIGAYTETDFTRSQVSPDGCLVTYGQRPWPLYFTEKAYGQPFELKVLNLCTGVFK